MGLILLATLGIESLYSRFSLRSSLANREDSIGFRDALKVLTASRQTGIFFTFLLVMSISLFMQDAVMEPYGGEVFGMEVSETAQLNAFFGIGTLIGIAATGFAIIPRLGKQRTVRLSCFGVAIALLGFIAAGISAVPESLMLALGIFGLASGVLTAGAIGLMLDLTAAETAGTFIGAWGLAQAIARGTSTILGGTVLDLGKALFEQPLLAYGLVFTVQAVGMGCAIALLRRVNIQEFQDNARAALSAVMEGELD
jgi:BCD family chlorophyll transporter-like MFS transporter